MVDELHPITRTKRVVVFLHTFPIVVVLICFSFTNVRSCWYMSACSNTGTVSNHMCETHGILTYFMQLFCSYVFLLLM
jgi:hypothetical protein